MGRNQPVQQQTLLNAPYVRLKGNAILRQKSRRRYRPASLPAWALCFRQRRELLNQHWFLTLADAADKLEAWRRYYN